MCDRSFVKGLSDIALYILQPISLLFSLLGDGITHVSLWSSERHGITYVRVTGAPGQTVNSRRDVILYTQFR